MVLFGTQNVLGWRQDARIQRLARLFARYCTECCIRWIVQPFDFRCVSPATDRHEWDISGHFEYESMGLPPMAGYDVILQSKNKKLTLGLTGVFKLDDMKLSNSYSVSAGFVGTRCAKGPGRDHDLCRSVLRRPSLLSTLLRDGNWYTALEPHPSQMDFPRASFSCRAMT